MRAENKTRMRTVLRDFEERALAGEPGAMRALVRQAEGPNTLTTRTVELRSVANGTGGERLLFEGYASVVDEPFEMQDWLGPYTELMRGGCFDKTLAESPDVIFCFNHDWNAVPMARTIAGTLRLSADATGLRTEADLDPGRDDVNRLRSAMDAGEIDAMSFAFWVTRQTWSPDYEQRDILEVDMDGGDASSVTWPANPATWGTTSLRKRQARALMRTRVPALIAERARTEKRAGKALSAATTEVLQQVLDLIADADEGLDAAQPILAELLGIENPDADDKLDDEAQSQSAPVPAQMSLSRLRLLEDPALRG